MGGIGRRRREETGTDLAVRPRRKTIDETEREEGNCFILIVEMKPEAGTSKSTGTDQVRKVETGTKTTVQVGKRP